MKFVLTEDIVSPKLLNFTESFNQSSSEDQNKLIGTFWEEIEQSGTPIFEEMDGIDDYYLVTFLFREEVTSNEYRVICSIFGLTADRNIMRQIPNTDIYFKSGYVLKNTKLIYNLSRGVSKSYNFFDPEDIPQGKTKDFVDPLNKYSLELKLIETYPRSLLVTPDAVLPAWRDYQKLQGRMEELWIDVDENYRAFIDSQLNLQQNHTGNPPAIEEDLYHYKVTIYLPPNYDQSEVSFPFIMLFDGKLYIHDNVIPGHKIMDYLITHNKIPPIIGIFLHNKDRTRELLDNHEFAKFITQKLIPDLRKNFRLSNDPQSAIVGGSSFGGLNSMFMGLHYSDTFGKILSQSGSFWIGSSYNSKDYLHLIRAYVEKEKVPNRIYMDIGEYEISDLEFGNPSQYWSSYHMRDVLNTKGYDYKFAVFNGGHDYVMWQETLVDGLIYLLESEHELTKY